MLRVLSEWPDPASVNFQLFKKKAARSFLLLAALSLKRPFFKEINSSSRGKGHSTTRAGL
jgi:hypothetical protein